MWCCVGTATHTSQPRRSFPLKLITYAAPLLALGLNACVGITAPGLVARESTAAAVDARLGPVTQVRAAAGGETSSYKLGAFSPQPQDLILPVSRDGVVREIYRLDEQRWS